MANTSSDSERLEQLELKIMDLENTMQLLNDAVLKQFRDIEQLRKHNDDLARKVDAFDSRGPMPGVKDEIPPHY